MFKQYSKSSSGPALIPASEHGIDLTQLDDGLIKILETLCAHGHQAYVVGGGIRDLIAGVKPKDFDVVTDASPEQIHKIFPKSFIVGRRFALVHVRAGWNHIIEVATFRGKYADKMLPGKFGRWLAKCWTYGSIDTDVWRRDTTINALYLSYQTGEITDYVGGYQDLHDHKICMIGDPETRFKEDPVRMLRVIRLAAKLGFDIDPQVIEGIHTLSSLLKGVSSSRLYGEVLRTFHGGFGVESFHLLRSFKLLSTLFPKMSQESDSIDFIVNCLQKADQRVAASQPVSGSFLFAIFLWHPLSLGVKCRYNGSRKQQFDHVSRSLLRTQQITTVVPRRVWAGVIEIWRLQHLLIVKNHAAAEKVMKRSLFRAGYDFLLLRAEYDDTLQPWAKWWQSYIVLAEEDRRDYALLKMKTAQDA